MSERTVRLCDLRESYQGPDVCQRPFKSVCAICSRDVCATHEGDTFAVSIGNNKAVYGSHWFRMCRDCSKATDQLYANGLDPTVFGVHAKSIIEQVRTTLCAALAAHKLIETAQKDP